MESKTERGGKEWNERERERERERETQRVGVSRTVIQYDLLHMTHALYIKQMSNC